MVIIFNILIAFCILYTLIQFAIGLTEIVIGLTQMTCALVMMAFIFLRRMIFGPRKQAFHRTSLGQRAAPKRRAPVWR